MSGLCHKSRDKPGNRKISNEIRTQIINLIKSTYEDFGPQLIHEQLKESHGISVSSEWIRLEMIKEGLWSVKKIKRKKIHQRRDRRERRGELIHKKKIDFPQSMTWCEVMEKIIY